MLRGGCSLQGLTSAVVRTGFLEEVRARWVEFGRDSHFQPSQHSPLHKLKTS